MTTRSLTADAFLRLTMEEPLYLIAPFMPTGGTMILHGPPGVGKTQLALTMAKALLAGESFLSPEYPARKSRVLLVEMDMGGMPILVQERLKAADLGSPDFMVMLPDPGTDFNSVDGAWVPSRDPGLTDAIRFHPDVVLIDTLRDVHKLEESDSATVSAVLGAWRRHFPAAALCFLHHDRKLQLVAGESPDRYWKESARGSGAWLAKADVGIHLTDAKGALSMVFTKTRICAAQPPLAVQQNPQTLLFELAAPTSRQKLLAWMQQNPMGKRDEAVKFLEAESGLKRVRANQIVAEYFGSGMQGRRRGSGNTNGRA